MSNDNARACAGNVTFKLLKDSTCLVRTLMCIEGKNKIVALQIQDLEFEFNINFRCQGFVDKNMPHFLPLSSGASC